MVDLLYVALLIVVLTISAMIVRKLINSKSVQFDFDNLGKSFIFALLVYGVMFLSQFIVSAISSVPGISNITPMLLFVFTSYLVYLLDQKKYSFEKSVWISLLFFILAFLFVGILSNIGIKVL